MARLSANKRKMINLIISSWLTWNITQKKVFEITGCKVEFPKDFIVESAELDQVEMAYFLLKIKIKNITYLDHNIQTTPQNGSKL